MMSAYLEKYWTFVLTHDLEIVISLHLLLISIGLIWWLIQYLCEKKSNKSKNEIDRHQNLKLNEKHVSKIEKIVPTIYYTISSAASVIITEPSTEQEKMKEEKEVQGNARKQHKQEKRREYKRNKVLRNKTEKEKTFGYGSPRKTIETKDISNEKNQHVPEPKENSHQEDGNISKPIETSRTEGPKSPETNNHDSIKKIDKTERPSVPPYQHPPSLTNIGATRNLNISSLEVETDNKKSVDDGSPHTTMETKDPSNEKDQHAPEPINISHEDVDKINLIKNLIEKIEPHKPKPHPIPPKKKEEDRPKPPSLRNMGATCYLNSAFQGISACNTFSHLISDLSVTYPDVRQLQVFKTLVDIMNGCSVNRMEISRNQIFRDWNKPGQQDSYELLAYALNQVYNELRKFMEGRGALKPRDLPAWLKVSLPMRFIIQYQIVCGCGKVTKSPLQSDLALHVTIPRQRRYHRTSKLSELIDLYFGEDYIEDYECERKGCDGKRTKRIATLQRPLPKTVCIHLQRTFWNGYSMVKIDDDVEFDMKLSLKSSYCCVDDDGNKTASTKEEAKIVPQHLSLENDGNLRLSEQVKENKVVIAETDDGKKILKKDNKRNNEERVSQNFQNKDITLESVAVINNRGNEDSLELHGSRESNNSEDLSVQENVGENKGNVDVDDSKEKVLNYVANKMTKALRKEVITEYIAEDNEMNTVGQKLELPEVVKNQKGLGKEGPSKVTSNNQDLKDNRATDGGLVHKQMEVPQNERTINFQENEGNIHDEGNSDENTIYSVLETKVQVAVSFNNHPECASPPDDSLESSTEVSSMVNNPHKVHTDESEGGTEANNQPCVDTSLPAISMIQDDDQSEDLHETSKNQDSDSPNCTANGLHAPSFDIDTAVEVLQENEITSKEEDNEVGKKPDSLRENYPQDQTLNESSSLKCAVILTIDGSSSNFEPSKEVSNEICIPRSFDSQIREDDLLGLPSDPSKEVSIVAEESPITREYEGSLCGSADEGNEEWKYKKVGNVTQDTMEDDSSQPSSDKDSKVVPDDFSGSKSSGISQFEDGFKSFVIVDGRDSDSLQGSLQGDDRQHGHVDSLDSFEMVGNELKEGCDSLAQDKGECGSDKDNGDEPSFIGSPLITKAAHNEGLEGHHIQSDPQSDDALSEVNQRPIYGTTEDEHVWPVKDQSKELESKEDKEYSMTGNRSNIEVFYSILVRAGNHEDDPASNNQNNVVNKRDFEGLPLDSREEKMIVHIDDKENRNVHVSGMDQAPIVDQTRTFSPSDVANDGPVCDQLAELEGDENEESPGVNKIPVSEPAANIGDPTSDPHDNAIIDQSDLSAVEGLPHDSSQGDEMEHSTDQDQNISALSPPSNVDVSKGGSDNGFMGLEVCQVPMSHNISMDKDNLQSTPASEDASFETNDKPICAIKEDEHDLQENDEVKKSKSKEHDKGLIVEESMATSSEYHRALANADKMDNESGEHIIIAPNDLPVPEESSPASTEEEKMEDTLLPQQDDGNKAVTRVRQSEIEGEPDHHLHEPKDGQVSQVEDISIDNLNLPSIPALNETNVCESKVDDLDSSTKGEAKELQGEEDKDSLMIKESSIDKSFDNIDKGADDKDVDLIFGTKDTVAVECNVQGIVDPSNHSVVEGLSHDFSEEVNMEHLVDQDLEDQPTLSLSPSMNVGLSNEGRNNDINESKNDLVSPGDHIPMDQMDLQSTFPSDEIMIETKERIVTDRNEDEQDSSTEQKKSLSFEERLICKSFDEIPGCINGDGFDPISVITDTAVIDLQGIINPSHPPAVEELSHDSSEENVVNSEDVNEVVYTVSTSTNEAGSDENSGLGLAELKNHQVTNFDQMPTDQLDLQSNFPSEDIPFEKVENPVCESKEGGQDQTKDLNIEEYQERIEKSSDYNRVFEKSINTDNGDKMEGDLPSTVKSSNNSDEEQKIENMHGQGDGNVHIPVLSPPTTEGSYDGDGLCDVQKENGHFGLHIGHISLGEGTSSIDIKPPVSERKEEEQDQSQVDEFKELKRDTNKDSLAPGENGGLQPVEKSVVSAYDDANDPTLCHHTTVVDGSEQGNIDHSDPSLVVDLTTDTCSSEDSSSVSPPITDSDQNEVNNVPLDGGSVESTQDAKSTEVTNIHPESNEVVECMNKEETISELPTNYSLRTEDRRYTSVDLQNKEEKISLKLCEDPGNKGIEGRKEDDIEGTKTDKNRDTNISEKLKDIDHKDRINVDKTSEVEGECHKDDLVQYHENQGSQTADLDHQIYIPVEDTSAVEKLTKSTEEGSIDKDDSTSNEEKHVKELSEKNILDTSLQTLDVDQNPVVLLSTTENTTHMTSAAFNSDSLPSDGNTSPLAQSSSIPHEEGNSERNQSMIATERQAPKRLSGHGKTEQEENQKDVTVPCEQIDNPPPTYSLKSLTANGDFGTYELTTEGRDIKYEAKTEYDQSRDGISRKAAKRLTISMETGHDLENTTNKPLKDEIPKKEISSEDTPQDVIKPVEDEVYDLVSVIVHYGTVHGGHYICYRKVGNQWFLTNDSWIREVSESEVLNCQAYILFYEQPYSNLDDPE